MLKCFEMLLLSGSILSGCSYYSVKPDTSRTMQSAGQDFSADSMLGCKNSLFSDAMENPGEFQPVSIDLLSWNVKKGDKDGWQEDINSLASGKELVLMQEAKDTMQLIEVFQGSGHWVFAEGYTSGTEKTGVVTRSRVAAIGQCELTHFEPWLGTPKATALTRYALQETSKTLVVVNTHMINFSLGIKHFRHQLTEIVDSIKQHEGPLIMSGDFNTWNKSRMKLVETMLSQIGLTKVYFRTDYRTRFFDSPVDHVFIRGLSVNKATTHKRDSSDHNPITINLDVMT